MKAWNPITWLNNRPDFLAWRYVDDTQTGIEILAYNYAYGHDLQAFYLERAVSLEVIGGQATEVGWCSSCDKLFEEWNKEGRPACPDCGDWLIFQGAAPKETK